jgi:hypothetical protein
MAVVAVGNNVIAAGPAQSTSWTTIALTAALAADLRGVWGHANGAVYAVGAGGAIRASGTLSSWGVEESGTNKQLNGVWAQPSPAPPCAAWAVGDTGTILCRQP